MSDEIRSINEINRSTQSGGATFKPRTPAASPFQNKKKFKKNQGRMATAASYSADAKNYHQKAEASAKSRKPLIIALSILLTALVGCGVAFAVYMNSISQRLNTGNKTGEEIAEIQDALGGYSSNFKEPFYMLLLGTDARPKDKISRTDTNIVARIDPINNSVSMLSIPRDTKIEIQGHGTQKFNAAYAFGKVPGVIKATEQLLGNGIKISHYAEVNFLELKGLVDAVGGVTVENESKIDNRKCDDGDGNHYVIPKGTVTLNGGQALTFARNRDYPAGDFVRTYHQRVLIKAIVDKVLKSSITSIPGIIDAASNTVTTDLAIADVVALAQQFADADDITMYNSMLPSYPQMINGISFVITDTEKAKETLKLFIKGEDPGEIVSNISAKPINTKEIDTTNTLISENDEEAISGTAKPKVPSAATTDKPSSGTSTGDSGTSTETPTKPEPTTPEPTKPDPTTPEPTKPEPTTPEPTKPETPSGG